MSGRVQGKVALITGAARGQGRSHALTLAREGADIIAVDICAPIETVTDYPMPGPEDLAETARLVEQHDRRCVTWQVDVRERRDLVDAVAEAVAQLGHLDIVVANAGIVVNSAEADSITFLDTITVNLNGVVNTVRAAMPHLGPGRVDRRNRLVRFARQPRARRDGQSQPRRCSAIRTPSARWPASSTIWPSRPARTASG